MNVKPLSETNRYLKDPVERERLVSQSVRSSCAVEGLQPKNDKTPVFNITHRKQKKIYKTTQ